MCRCIYIHIDYRACMCVVNMSTHATCCQHPESRRCNSMSFCTQASPKKIASKRGNILGGCSRDPALCSFTCMLMWKGARACARVCTCMLFLSLSLCICMYYIYIYIYTYIHTRYTMKSALRESCSCYSTRLITNTHTHICTPTRSGPMHPLYICAHTVVQTHTHKLIQGLNTHT
jgi:hypothetical protein